ncbi:MAG: hypothetical protein WD696_01740 [Bryobacteraceae bacterium]
MAEGDREIEIRTRATGLREAVSALDSRIKDAYVKSRLRFVANTTDDVTRWFVGTALEERRTPAELSRWLDAAEYILAIAEHEYKSVSEIVEKVGPDLKSY